jgi:hypothetical protein
MNKLSKLAVVGFLVMTVSGAAKADIGEFIDNISQYLGCALSFGIANFALSSSQSEIGAVGCAASLATSYHLSKNQVKEPDFAKKYVTQEELEKIKKEYDAKMGHQEQKHETYRRVLRKAVARKLEQQSEKIRNLRNDKSDLRIEANQSKTIVNQEVKRLLEKLREQSESEGDQ